MKSCIIFLSAVLLSAVVHTKSVAQNQKFFGSWRIDMDRTLAIMNSDVKRLYDTLSTEAHTRAVNAMKDHQFAFSEDGGVAVNWTAGSQPRVSRGNWAINDPPGDLQISVGGRTTVYSYEFPSKTTLILRGKQRKGFFDNLCLEKIN